MAHAVRQQPTKVFKGTVDEVFSHRSEIPLDATVELKVYENLPNEGATTSATSPTTEPQKIKKLKAYGMLAGTTNVEDFLRRKHEDTIREDQPISERSRS